MADRKINDERSVRLGARVYRAGDEDVLLEQIQPKHARRLQQQGVLSGDWSGAKGEYRVTREQSEVRRVRRSPLGRALRAMGVEGASVQTEDTDTGDGTGEGGKGDTEYAQPYTARPGPGGWYTFHDANDQQLMEGGRAVKVQGEDAANKRLARLNKR